MRLPKILRAASFRLALGYALLFAMSAVAVGAFVYASINSTLDQQRRSRIDAAIAFLEEKYRSEGLGELTEEVQQLIGSTIASGLDYLVLGPGRKPVAGNLPFIPDAAGWSDIEYSRTAPLTGTDRVLLHVVDFDDSVRLAVGADLDPADEITGVLRGAIAWWILGLGLVAATGGALASASLRRRINAISQTADAIISGDLAQRVPLRGRGDDFDRLAAALNRMLDRIGELMESLRQVSNDVAHSLRSPLTRLRQRLEGARDEAASREEWENASQAAIAEIDAVMVTISALLRIAQVESGTQRAGFHEVDLSRLFTAVCDAYAPVAEDDGRTLTMDIAPGVRMFGDKDLLTQMLANVVENAIQHTPPGARIEVRLLANGPMASVADTGTGVRDAERARIFDRFYRASHDGEKQGLGLGLALVTAIAGLHGIALSAEDNRPGLRIVMRFGAPV